jgi:Ca2+/Na+ antiporter
MLVTWNTHEDIVLESSPTLLVSLGVILVATAGTAAVVSRTGYTLCRWWGFALVGIYMMCMVVNVVLEIEIA